jgi:hypothetical protein
LSMSKPVQYFQATAAAIPTLLNAIAVGMKGGIQYADYMNSMKSGSDRSKVILWAIGLIYVIAGGEVAALIAILTNNGSLFQAGWAFAAVIFCFLALASEFIRPVLQIMTAAERRITNTALFLGLFAAITIFMFTLVDI